MSMYGGSSDDWNGGLYDVKPKPTEQPATGSNPAPEQSAGGSSSDGATQALEVMANPASLLSEVIPPDPADSKLPYGLAILGACIVAIIWANSLEGGGK